MSGAVGPLWTDGDGGRFGGRYPLAVERHAMAQVGHLLPGVTTQTSHARYYTLHAAVFAEARAHGLDEARTRQLFRRAEVVMGSVSIAHATGDPQAHAGMGGAHGIERLGSKVSDGMVDMAALSGDGGYSQPGWGFWGAYAAPEFALGLLATEAQKTVPGPNADVVRLRAGFDGLFDLTDRSTLTAQDLADASHLCICRCRTSADGDVMREALVPQTAAAMHAGDRRGQSLRMLLRLAELTAEQSAPVMPRELVFGVGREDPVLQALDAFPAWTGVVLRNFTVAGWRNLWAYLVQSIEGFMPIQALGEAFADELPSGTVGDFVRSCPAGLDGQGRLVGAEFLPEIQDGPVAVERLSRLVIGAMRHGRLENRVQSYFETHASAGPGTWSAARVDEHFQQLTPSWMKERLTEWDGRPLRDFAVWLTHQLVDRAQRVALMKAGFDAKTGQFKVPTRVFVRDGHLFRDSYEAGGGVALRWSTAFNVMAGVGLVERVEDRWHVTDLGRTA